MSKIIGIDLGTTNSCVAVLEGGEPTVLQVLKVAELPHQSLGLQKMEKGLLDKLQSDKL